MSDIETDSPALRRSPRFMRAAGLLRPTANFGSPNGPHTPAESHRRRLQFQTSVEPVSIPRSVDANRDPSVAATTSSALTGAHDDQSVRFTHPSLLSHVGETQNSDTRSPPSAAPSGIQESSSGRGEDAPREVGAVVMDDDNAESEDGKVRISTADDLTRVFAFVCDISVKKIRIILKCWDWRQSGLKEALVAKVMLHIGLALRSGKNLYETLSTNEETARYESWLRMRLSKDEIYPVLIDRIPDEASLISLLSEAEANEYRGKKASLPRTVSRNTRRTSLVPADRSTPSETEIEPAQTEQLQTNANRTITDHRGIPENTQFGINEFARLLITMRDDEDARSAVIAMGQELSRAQLDTGVTRGDFWLIVESRFNDSTQHRFLNLAGAVDGVDSSLVPLAHRTSTFLKDKFNDAKADFTQYVTRWSASGQNDPDRFRNFLPKLPSGELNALGKRMMVMFVCTRKGTPFEEEHFSNVCCKLIPGGAGLDEGSRMGSFTADGATTGQRKKRAQPESEGVKEIASSLTRIASCYQGRKKHDEVSSSEKLLKDYSCRLKKIKILEDVVKKLSTHPSGNPSTDGVPGENSLIIALRKLERDVSKDLLTDAEDDS